MTQPEIDLSLKMFGKFLSSKQGVELAHKFSDDIIFKLNPIQTLNPESIRKERGNYWVMVDIIYNKPSEVMITWKNVPSHMDMRRELKKWLPVFGFSNNVNVMILHTKKDNNFPS